jgi:hypothetical protein
VLAPGDHRAGEREHRDLDIEAGPELAAGDAAAEHRPHRLPARLHHALLVQGDQPRVALALGVQQRVVLGVARVAGIGRHHLEHRDQVIADGLALRLGQRPLERGERRDQQVFLARPAPVERGLADPGPGGDVLAAHAVDAALADGLDGRLEQRLLGLLAAGAPRAAGGRSGGGHVVPSIGSAAVTGEATDRSK